VKQEMGNTHLADVPEHSLSDKRILTYIQMHLASGYPDLIPTFMAACTSPSRSFYYSGPTIELRRKDNDYRLRVRSLRMQENHDFAGAPLAPNQLQSALTRAFNDSDSSGDDEDGEGEEEGSSPLSWPSPSDSSMRPPPPPATPPRKRGPPSPASTPSKTPSSNRPKKRVK
jgi:hypothetical protein